MTEHEPSSFRPSSEEKVDKPVNIGGMDDYQREKVDYTLQDVDSLSNAIKNYTIINDFAREKGITLSRASDEFDRLRRPKGPAGPDSDLKKLRTIFDRARIEAFKEIPAAHQAELEQRFISRDNDQ